MTPGPLALTQKQFDAILIGANAIYPQWRSRFLDAVVDQLLTLDAIGDHDVECAIDNVLKHLNAHSALKSLSTVSSDVDSAGLTSSFAWRQPASRVGFG